MTINPFSRKSGILLHPSSFPGPEGIGTFGSEARDFLDFCVQAGQSLWQMCPLGPTGYGDSPYQCFSAFAGNPLLVDLRLLQKLGWLKISDIENQGTQSGNHIDFGPLIKRKDQLLRKAFATFQESLKSNSSRGRSLSAQFERFKLDQRNWLPDFSLFMSLKNNLSSDSWHLWPDDIKFRQPAAMKSWKDKLANEIVYHEFLQFVFFQQWLDLTAYAHQRGIKTIGDMPIFVAFDSADVWSHPEFFLLDSAGFPTEVAGVPPDYFSSTGQLWGNPLYDWSALQKDDFSWWIDVLRSKLAMYDYIRIDHFRGFASFWAVPFGESTAINGIWRPAPGKALFSAVKAALGPAPIIAEDLGLITSEVGELMQHCGFPGMKVLQFAFDSSEDNDHIPHNYQSNSIVYTGTHDNDTVIGWFDAASPQDQAYACAYLKIHNRANLHWDFIQACHASVAAFSIVPLQDLLGLDSSARMNTPGRFGGNWTWRANKDSFKSTLATKFRELTILYGRL